MNDVLKYGYTDLVTLIVLTIIIGFLNYLSFFVSWSNLAMKISSLIAMFFLAKSWQYFIKAEKGRKKLIEYAKKKELEKSENDAS